MTNQRGFTLLELLITSLIVGILAAVATPLYLGYVRDARASEGKTVAGSLWVATQALAMTRCGIPIQLRHGFDMAGLRANGETPDGRWTAQGDDNTILVDCQDGHYTTPGTVFTLVGQAADVQFARVRLLYRTEDTPPAHLECSTDSGQSFRPC
jgi:prepilin-type N-terminal cleavage/methylation domain-containing protein